MKPTVIVTDAVQKIEGPKGRIYVGLAKLGLWMCALILTLLIVLMCLAGIGDRTLIRGASVVSNVIQACQVLSMISITVLGYHGYHGTRILHALRHWNDEGDQPTGIQQ
jgi:hypothetical protein